MIVDTTTVRRTLQKAKNTFTSGSSGEVELVQEKTRPGIAGEIEFEVNK